MMDARLLDTQSAPFLRGQRRNHLPPSCQRLLLPFRTCGCPVRLYRPAGRLFRHRIFYICSFMLLSSVTHLSSPASCSGVAVMSRHASQFVYTRPASLRIMLAAYCPNDPSGAGKTMAPPLPHAASGGISRPAPAGRVDMEENMDFRLQSAFPYTFCYYT